MSERVFNVLFVCTSNSARSILAESLLNHLGRGRFRAYSAGSHPAGQVNRLALELLEQEGLPVEGLRSKSWDDFATPDSPALDFVFTVCDKAAGEICPVWQGGPVTAHWGIEDPAAVQGGDDARRHAFSSAYLLLSHRISLLLSLPIQALDEMSLRARLDDIGRVQA